MRTWFAAGGAALLAIAAVVLWRSERAPAPSAAVQAFADVTAPTPLAAPLTPEPARHRRVRAIAPDAYEPDSKTTEEKRLARYDKDRDGFVSKDEYLASRKKSFEKLDLNHDGKLSFEEYAAKAEAKFDAADERHTGKLTPEEFAATAVKHRAKARCAPPEAAPQGDA